MENGSQLMHQKKLSGLSVLFIPRNDKCSLYHFPLSSGSTKESFHLHRYWLCSSQVTYFQQIALDIKGLGGYDDSFYCHPTTQTIITDLTEMKRLATQSEDFLWNIVIMKIVIRIFSCRLFKFRPHTVVSLNIQDENRTIDPQTINRLFILVLYQFPF